MASMLAGTVTNADESGYFQGTSTAPLEATSHPLEVADLVGVGDDVKRLAGNVDDHSIDTHITIWCHQQPGLQPMQRVVKWPGTLSRALALGITNPNICESFSNRQQGSGVMEAAAAHAESLDCDVLRCGHKGEASCQYIKNSTCLGCLTLRSNALFSVPGHSTSLCMGCRPGRWWRQNGDVGVDRMIINIASMLPGIVTNPYKSAYFQGMTSASLEAAGIHRKNAYAG
ncbi:EXORDIUM protein [Nymphaea thermarum]|nr:EXORDIUM protein [Nymphaea thermarum]